MFGISCPIWVQKPSARAAGRMVFALILVVFGGARTVHDCDNGFQLFIRQFHRLGGG